MVFNPEGTMLPDKETETMLNTEPVGKTSPSFHHSSYAQSQILSVHSRPLYLFIHSRTHSLTHSSSLFISHSHSASDLAIEPELLKKAKTLEAEGVLLAEKDDIAGAIAKFTEVIELCPTYASGYNNRAQAYRIQDNTAAALQDLDKAIEHGSGQTAILKQV